MGHLGGKTRTGQPAASRLFARQRVGPAIDLVGIYELDDEPRARRERLGLLHTPTISPSKHVDKLP